MISEEEKKEIDKLKSLLYTNSITQYGKRKLIGLYENLIEKQQELIRKYYKEYYFYLKSYNESEKELIEEKKLSNKMGEHIIKYNKSIFTNNIEELKEYFRKKVENEK